MKKTTNKNMLMTIRLGINRTNFFFQNNFILKLFLYFKEVKIPDEKAKTNKATVVGIQRIGIVFVK